MDQADTAGYTIRQASEKLGLAEITVRKMIRGGRIGAHLERRKHGMTWVLTEEDIRRFQEPGAVEVYTPGNTDIMRSIDHRLSGIEGSSTMVLQEIRVLTETVTALQQEVAQLRTQQEARSKRRWPWGR